MTMEEKIRANAEMTIAMLGPVSGVDGFGYNAASVEWLDGFIERQRIRPEFDDSERSQLVSNIGSYLGECVIACFGGAWQLRDGMWCVAFNSANAAFPFNKVMKQFKNGREGGDSIYSWFTMIPGVFLQQGANRLQS